MTNEGKFFTELILYSRDDNDSGCIVHQVGISSGLCSFGKNAGLDVISDVYTKMWITKMVLITRCCLFLEQEFIFSFGVKSWGSTIE